MARICSSLFNPFVSSAWFGCGYSPKTKRLEFMWQADPGLIFGWDPFHDFDFECTGGSDRMLMVIGHGFLTARFQSFYRLIYGILNFVCSVHDACRDKIHVGLVAAPVV